MRFVSFTYSSLFILFHFSFLLSIKRDVSSFSVVLVIRFHRPLYLWKSGQRHSPLQLWMELSSSRALEGSSLSFLVVSPLIRSKKGVIDREKGQKRKEKRKHERKKAERKREREEETRKKRQRRLRLS